MNALASPRNVTAFPPHLLLSADVRAATSGDLAAFERLVAATQRMIASVALGVVRDVRTSEDVAQEVYLQAWRDLRTLKNADSFLPWIRQLTRNKALDAARSRQRHDRRHPAWEPDCAEVAARELGTLDRAVAEEERIVLGEAIDALPDDAREVLTLFYREDQSVRQVAELLGLGEDAVKKRLERARAALREDVRVRFEAIATRTAPAAAFTAAVLAALTIAAPSTAAAATAAGATLAKTAGGLAASALAGALIGVGAGTVGVVYGTKRVLAGAIDGQERAEILRYRNKTIALVAAFSFAISAAPFLLGSIGRVGLAVFVTTIAVGFSVLVMRMSLVELPRILARRHEKERLADPIAFATKLAREARGRRIGIAFGLLGAAIGIACGVYFSLNG